MSHIEALRRRIVGALLDSAVTDADPGGAETAVFYADHYRAGKHIEGLHEDYAERVEHGVREHLREIVGFHCRGTKLRAIFDGGGHGTWVDYGDQRSAINAHRRLSALRAGDTPPPEVRS